MTYLRYNFATIDPGKHFQHVALWGPANLGKALRRVVSLPSGETFPWDKAIVTDLVVQEIPQQDGRTVPAQTLIDMGAGQLIAGRLAGPHGRVVSVQPRQWIKARKKPHVHRWMWPRLSLAEQEVIGGQLTDEAIRLAGERGAADRWRKKSSGDYYRKRELPKGMSHDLLDAVALGVWWREGGSATFRNND